MRIVKIDISRPEGTTLHALEAASAILKRTGDGGAIILLKRKVFASGSAEEARRHITDATNGKVTFYDGSKQDA